jgi:hypothetical protein
MTWRRPLQAQIRATVIQRNLKPLNVMGGAFAEAFAAEPGLPESSTIRSRYLAACSAALTRTGAAADGADLSTAERRRWRNLARDWLWTDLAAWSKRLESGQARDRAEARAMPRRCQKEPDLAGVRDPVKLADLPKVERDA